MSSIPLNAALLVPWPQQQLAKAASIGVVTLRSFERGERDPRAKTLESIVGALEAAGVIMIAENGEGAGVRIRKTRKLPA